MSRNLRGIHIQLDPADSPSTASADEGQACLDQASDATRLMSGPYASLAAFRRAHALPAASPDELQAHGQALRRLCRKHRVSVKKVVDSRFPFVLVYPVAVLAEYYGVDLPETGDDAP